MVIGLFRLATFPRCGVAMGLFRVGDKVRCVNALSTLLIKEDEIDSANWLYISGLVRWYHSNRFLLANEYPTLRGGYGGKHESI